VAPADRVEGDQPALPLTIPPVTPAAATLRVLDNRKAAARCLQLKQYLSETDVYFVKTKKNKEKTYLIFEHCGRSYFSGKSTS
jgi:hypothetical protein